MIAVVGAFCCGPTPPEANPPLPLNGPAGGNVTDQAPLQVGVLRAAMAHRAPQYPAAARYNAVER